MKDFASWHKLKQNLQQTHNLPTYNQREIWWCSIGVNLGHEEDGKNKFFNRPVLIIRKFNQNIFLGIPLSTQAKDSPYYSSFEFKGKRQCAMLSQLRTWDTRRLTHKMGKLSKEDFDKIKRKIINLIN